MQATGTGGFVFDGAGSGVDHFTNTGQSVDILGDSKLDLINNTVVVDGTLAVTGNGVINALEPTVVTMQGVTITDTDTVTVVQGDDQLVFITSGLTNDGKWQMNSAGTATDLVFNGRMTLGGTGEIVMGDNTSNWILGATSQILTQDPGHTIRGGGQLLNSGGSMPIFQVDYNNLEPNGVALTTVIAITLPASVWFVLALLAGCGAYAWRRGRAHAQ